LLTVADYLVEVPAPERCASVDVLDAANPCFDGRRQRKRSHRDRCRIAARTGRPCSPLGSRRPAPRSARCRGLRNASSARRPTRDAGSRSARRRIPAGSFGPPPQLLGKLLQTFSLGPVAEDDQAQTFRQLRERPHQRAQSFCGTRRAALRTIGPSPGRNQSSVGAGPSSSIGAVTTGLYTRSTRSLRRRPTSATSAASAAETATIRSALG